MPSVTSINPFATSSMDGPGQGRVPIKTMGQQEFLKLLVTKMTSQDPLNPQGDAEFIAQMAQFSALEQAKAMERNMEYLAAQQQVITANGLIGRSVTLTDGKTDIARGIVQSVAVTATGPQVVVDGINYDLGAVSSISPVTETAIA